MAVAAVSAAAAAASAVTAASRAATTACFDDGYRGDNWRGGGVYIGGGGYGYGDCIAPLGDWPRGTCDQF